MVSEGPIEDEMTKEELRNFMLSQGVTASYLESDESQDFERRNFSQKMKTQESGGSLSLSS